MLYLQMFDSVLWYVNAYVDSSAVNDLLAPVMNGIYGLLGVDIDWHFDIEFVTVINAFTIIGLLLFNRFAVHEEKTEKAQRPAQGR